MIRWTLLALVALVMGCGVLRPQANGDPVAGFPHPDGYSESHALPDEGGAAGCGDCHAAQDDALVRGAEPTAPACRSCHASHPHPRSFVHGLVHGARWRADPSECAGCHGADGARAAGGVARGLCGSCHTTYPHPEGFEEPAGHGVAVRSRGMDACVACHGEDGSRIEEGACAECHLPPHPEGFATDHGNAWAATPDACADCHADDGAPGRRTCASCHDLFPHPADFGIRHAATAARRGDGACAGCHPAGLPGPDLPVSCGPACHDRSAP